MEAAAESDALPLALAVESLTVGRLCACSRLIHDLAV